MSQNPSTTEQRLASRALGALHADRRPQPRMDGIRPEPTTPRDNPPIDEGRVARVSEDYRRTLG
jgi:hypothetical protein